MNFRLRMKSGLRVLRSDAGPRGACRRATLVGFVLSILCSPAGAHDFWIEPSTFTPQVDEHVKIGLRVGEQFIGEPVARNPNKIAMTDGFVLRGPNTAKIVLGRDGEDPAGFVSLDRPGMFMVGYRSTRSSIELEAEKFEEYLKSEGLEAISRMRAERGESSLPGKEVYSRSAKVVLNAGSRLAMAMEPRFNYTFEIVPERNPSTLRIGIDEFGVLLLYEGKPAPHIVAFAMNKADAKSPIQAVSDSQGRVSFKLPRAGVWMIKAIHMARAPKDAGADWESIWGTLTFEIPEQTKREP